MTETLGARISNLRKEKKLTQEALAEKLNVSPQAISKWENDQSCPDIMLLPTLAQLLGVSTDVLLSGEKKPAMQVLPPEERKKFEDMQLRIYVFEDGEEEARISIPLMLCKIMLENGLTLDTVMNGKSQGVNAVKSVDLQHLITLVENGCIGTLVEVDATDGVYVRVCVE
ncbi:MAG: helix-turn-helix transcriptional regulator [Clostridia bacterium]|nr:helix-turn-helix transcriptional regulator [Clostridia bacterium]